MSSIEHKKNGINFLPNEKRVFFKLKDHNLIQKVLINTLLIKSNCFIDDLANLLHIDEKKLHQVLQGECTLKGKKSQGLVSLFYMLLN